MVSPGMSCEPQAAAADRAWSAAQVRPRACRASAETGKEDQFLNPCVRILRPGDEPRLEAFLVPHIETSMFLLGNMRASGLVDGGETYQGTYAAAICDGAISAVVAHCWNQVMILQAPSHAAALCRAAGASSHRPVAGLIGPGRQVAVAAKALGVEDSQVQVDEVEDLYRLPLAQLVVPHLLQNGAFTARLVAAADVPTVAQWNMDYQVEALGATRNRDLEAACLDKAERAVEEGKTWVLEHEGRLVAMSAFNAATREAVQIGGVWTPPALRRRGYARSVVAASLLDARSIGVETAILFTGTHNLAAQKAYLALGFEPVGEYRILLLRSPLEAVPPAVDPSRPLA